MSRHSLRCEVVLAASPTTIRAVPTHMDAHDSVLAYGSGNCIITRPLSHGGEVRVCTLHRAPVTTLRFSDEGAYVASGDRDGVVIVWKNTPEMHQIYTCRALQGAVRDIAWCAAGTSQLVAVGEGKAMPAVLISDEGRRVEALPGHARPVMSCDARDAAARGPVITGSVDALLRVFQRAPCNFVASVDGHENSVTCVRYNPDASVVATTSSSSHLMLLDGASGLRRSLLPTHHTGTVYAAAWSPSGTELATVGADRSICICDVKSERLLHRVVLGDHLMDMQQGVIYTAEHDAITVSLGGALTVVDTSCGAVKDVLRGHQGRILSLQTTLDGSLLSVSVEGRVLRWGGVQAPGSARQADVPVDFINSAAFCGDVCYIVAGTRLFKLCSSGEGRSRGSADDITELSSDVRQTSALAVTAAGQAVLLYKSSVAVYSPDGEAHAALPLPRFEGTSIDARGQLVALGGDRQVKIYSVSEGGDEDGGARASPLRCASQFLGHHAGVVTCVRFTPDGQRVASGDASRQIFTWSAADGAPLQTHFVYHSAAITTLDFSPDGGRLLSGSLDGSLVVWSLANKTRVVEDNAHRNGVTATLWSDSGRIISAGGDYCIRIWHQPS